MKPIANLVHRGYGRWMDRWENDLCFRATDRIVRPFEFGLDWASKWPCTQGFLQGTLSPKEYIVALNHRAIESSDEFFGYRVPGDFSENGEWVEFTSPVETAFAENNRAKALWFPARNDNRKAVVVLPHWNAKLPQHNALCQGLQRLGLSTLRLSLPYHDARMPAELNRADYSVSSNICRTIDATRQAVIDLRCCLDWLQQKGYERLGVVGTSLGSCYAFLAAAHDSRVNVNVFNHCSTYFADPVWEGLSTRHIRESLEDAVDLPSLREMWLAISPPAYTEKFTAQRQRSKFIYTQYDTTFPVHLSRTVIKTAKEQNWDYVHAVLPCGHYTMGEFPFKFLTGYNICAFLKKSL